MASSLPPAEKTVLMLNPIYRPSVLWKRMREGNEDEGEDTRGNEVGKMRGWQGQGLAGENAEVRKICSGLEREGQP